MMLWSVIPGFWFLSSSFAQPVPGAELLTAAWPRTAQLLETTAVDSLAQTRSLVNGIVQA